MKNKLFEILPYEIFTPFVSKYKDIYVDALFIIFNSFQNMNSYSNVLKEAIQDDLTLYFNTINEEYEDELNFDSFEYKKSTTSSEKANSVIRYLRENKWIEFERTQDFNQTINLFDYSIDILNFLMSMIKNSNREIEFVGLIASIDSELKDPTKYKKPYEYVLKPVIEKAEELNRGLKRLSTNIKKYNNLRIAFSNERLLLEHWEQYYSEIGSTAFHRLKTDGNIFTFRQNIVNNLSKILFDSEIFNLLVKNYMEVEQTSEQDAIYDLDAKLLNIIDHFKTNIDFIIDEIGERHDKYNESAYARTSFLLSNSKTLSGKIQKILSCYAVDIDKSTDLNDEDDIASKYLNIYQQKYIDYDSLFNQYSRKTKGEIDKLSMHNDADLLAFENNKERLRVKRLYGFTKNNIENYVLSECLGERHVVSSDMIPIQSKKDLVRIMFIEYYSYKSNKYYIELNSVTTGEMYKYKNFTIIRRQK